MSRKKLPPGWAPLRFGLIDGQLSPRSDKIAHNAGWYDARGRKIGDGDLSGSDLRRVAAGLRKGEAFIVLPEPYAKHAFAFPEQFRGAGPRGSERRPGLAYVLRHASFAALPRRLHVVDRYGGMDPQGWEYRALRFRPISPEALAAALRGRRG